MAPTADEIARTLALESHPEGGWFRETYRADEVVATERGPRSLSTAILFLVSADAPSRFHRLTSDEVWIFQGGLPLELITLEADGESRHRVLGDPSSGARELPQALVPGGVWQAARVAGAPAGAGAGAWSLVSCLVTPGFAFEDFELAVRHDLEERWPTQAELIAGLT